MNTFDEALDNAKKTHEEIVKLASSITGEYTKEVDEIINHVKDHVNELNNDQLRALITDLSFKAYSLGEAKEYSALKSEISKTLRDEIQATTFNTSAGTMDVRRNNSILESENEQLVKLLCDSVSGLLKVKLDETHRIVDTLKTVILTRNTEAKINADINDTREGI